MPTVTEYLWVGLGLFLLIVIGLAYLGWKETNTMADFAVASENLGPYTLGTAYTATFFSAATFVGYVGWSYQYGLSNIWIILALIGSAPIALVLFAKRVREINIHQKSLSLPDWLGEFYNSQFIRVATALAVMFNIFYVAAQLDAGALFFTIFLDMDQSTALGIITAIVVLYVLAGGTYADVYTDAIQAVLMAIMGIVIFSSGFFVLNTGFFETFTLIGSRLESLDPNLVQPVNQESPIYSGAFAIFSVLFLEFVFSAQPQLFNKVLSLNKLSEIKKMIGVYVMFSILCILVVFVGFYMIVLDPTLETADRAIFVYTLEYLPPLLTAFLGVVILAAALSTTDGIFIVLATAIGNDIFLKFLVEEGYIEMGVERADTVSRYLAQGVVLIVGIFAYVIALTAPVNIAELFWIAVAGVGAATMPPVILGIYFPNFVTRKAAIVTVIIGPVSYIILSLVSVSPSVLVHGTYAVLIATIPMILISIITQQEPGVGPASSPATTQEQQSDAGIASSTASVQEDE